MDKIILYREELIDIFRRELEVRGDSRMFNSCGMCTRLFSVVSDEARTIFSRWFVPYKFDIHYLYSRRPGHIKLWDDTLLEIPIRDYGYQTWYMYKIEDVPKNRMKEFFWYPVEPEFDWHRVKVLEKAIKLLESYGED